MTQLKTEQIVQGNYILFFTYTSLPVGMGYSGNYAVLWEDYGENHVIRTGTSTSNFNDKPNMKILKEFLDTAINQHILSFVEEEANES